MNPSPSACPCGSGTALAACCGRFLSGAPAPTAERLMRARYSANVLNDAAFLRASWHASTRPEHIDPAQGPVWLGLEIRTVTGGQTGDVTGTVEFIARYRDDARSDALHETSRFVREQGRWYYLDGHIHATAAEKTGRNDPCPCGSGRKFKRCCG